MASFPRRFYWDACAWIAFIQQEQLPDPNGIVEDRESMCRSVLVAAKEGKAEIVTSTLSLAEVCKNPASVSREAGRFADFLELDYVLLVSVDRAVGEKAREIMQGGIASLKPADAIHAATAIVANVEALHTFDRKLLSLDGLLTRADGSKLRICKPDVGEPDLPLFAMTTPK